MKAKRSLLLISVFITVSAMIVGCIATKQKDGTTSYSLLPKWEKKLDQVEQFGEGALGMTTTLAPFLGPVGGIVAGSLATGLTILKKVKPKLTQAQDKYQLSHTVASISVEALEQIKKDHPEVWKTLAEKLQKECEESGIDTKIVKNAIRGLRGLPPKV